MAKRSTAGLVKYVKFLVDAGAMSRPRWLSAVERMPPPPLPRPGRRPPTLRFPEDDLAASVLARRPELRLRPVALGSFEPPPERRAALRQLELEARGTPRREARAAADAELEADERRRAAARAPGAPAGVIEEVQAEEEAALRAAMAKFVAANGPVRAPPPAAAAAPGAGHWRLQQRPRPPPPRQRPYGAPPAGGWPPPPPGWRPRRPAEGAGAGAGEGGDPNV